MSRNIFSSLSCFRKNYISETSLAVSLAITSSSFVGISMIVTSESSVEMIVSLLWFLSGSILKPRFVRPSQMSALTVASFSPMPAVNTRASAPLS